MRAARDRRLLDTGENRDQIRRTSGRDALRGALQALLYLEAATGAESRAKAEGVGTDVDAVDRCGACADSGGNKVAEQQLEARIVEGCAGQHGWELAEWLDMQGVAHGIARV